MSQRRIFVVEDEALIAMEIQDHLRTLGYGVAGHAARGSVALQEIPRARPDLVLMDVNLGRGINGIDVALQLREVIDVPVVFLTAYSDVELAERAARTESYAYIVKPFQPQALRANIEMAIYKHAAERRLCEATRRLDEGAAALRAQAEALGRSVSLLQATLDATADGIVVVSGGALQGVNQRLQAIWGLSEAPRSLDELASRLVRPDELLREAPAGEGDLIELRDGRILARRVRPQLVAGVEVGRVYSFRDVTPERRAEAQLRESEERFRRVVENISDALVVDDLAGRVVFANDRFCELFAVDRGALAERSVEDFVAPSFRAFVSDLRRRLREDGEPTTRSIFEGRRADGTSLWVEADIVALPSGTQLTVRDVTERRETEEALRILSTGLVHLTGDALLAELIGELSRIVHADVGIVGALSTSDADWSRTIALWVDGVAEAPGGCALGELPSLDDGGSLVVVEGARARFPESRALERFGAEACALAPLVDSEGRRIGVIGVLFRAPLRQRSRVATLLGLFAVVASANLDRQREAKKVHDLFEYSPDAVLMVDGEGTIVMANIRAQELLGYPRDELVGLSVDAMVPGENQGVHAILRRRYLAQPRVRPMGSLREPLRARRKDGTTVAVDISLGPIHVEDELLVVVSLRDMTHHVLAEERRASLELRLRHSQKLEALGTLAGGIAHDFNNILAALVANTDLARTEIDRSHVVHGRLMEIAAAADRATLLVRQILAFGRRQPPRRTITTLAPVVDEAVRLLRATLPARISLKVEVVDGSPNVLADATQLHQVIMNLGTNALHAIDEVGGLVTIRLDEFSDTGGARFGASPGSASLTPAAGWTRRS